MFDNFILADMIKSRLNLNLAIALSIYVYH